MIAIDAHQHFWRIARGDYGWLTAAGHPAIHRDFGPEDIAPHLAATGITATVLIQAAPTLDETKWLLALARDTPTVAGVVGWIDFEAADAIDTISALADDPLLLGLRPMVQDIADPTWLARPTLTPVFDAMVRLGLRFDALVKPDHLPALATLLGRHPSLAVVIDHGAKPAIAHRQWEPWAFNIADIAATSTACCKLSGLASEAGADWDVNRLRPYVDHLVACFGYQRLMWGSDWPVVEEAGGYRRWYDTVRALIDPAWHAAVFGANVARFYGLDAVAGIDASSGG